MDWFKNKKYAYIFVGICIVIICIIICVIFESGSKQKDNYNIEEDIDLTNNVQAKDEIKPNEIIVHIAGEIANPGIIHVIEGSRVVDVVEKAGGFTAEADIDKVNLAYEVKDEQKIVIPNINRKEEVKIIDNDDSFIVKENDEADVININTATQSELEALTGIGPSMASKILDYREKNGKFKSKEDIKNVPGIGNSKYEAIKDEICVK